MTATPPQIDARMTTQITPAALVVTLQNDSAGLPARDAAVTTAPQLLYTDAAGAAQPPAQAPPVTVTVHYEAVPAPALPAGAVALLLPAGARPDLTRPIPPGVSFAGFSAARVTVILAYAGLAAGQSERYAVALAGQIAPSGAGFQAQAAPLAWTLAGGQWRPAPAQSVKGGTQP